MYRVKINGAGSIGNHLGHAARTLGWSVDICDIDAAALERTRRDIYPARYGKWDCDIGLYRSDEAPTGGYDMIFIGTPPDSHLGLALAALEESPRAVLVEKPLCTPDLANAQLFADALAGHGIHGFVGYDHVVGAAAQTVGRLIADEVIGAMATLDVEFREYWGGIFAAHPWLDGPTDSYLGFWQRGGGALGEHSHALNLWQHFARCLGAGRVCRVSATVDYVDRDGADYDRIGLINLTTETGLIGRVVQDVVTSPPRKWARIQGEAGFIEWHCGHEPGVDLVRWQDGAGELRHERFEKTRPDDFIAELRHIDDVISGRTAASPLAAANGLETMLVIAAAHKSAREGRAVEIDYARGYTPAALHNI